MVLAKLPSGLAPGQISVSVCKFYPRSTGCHGWSACNLCFSRLCSGEVALSWQAGAVANDSGNTGDSVSNVSDPHFFGAEVGTPSQHLRRVDFADDRQWLWYFSATTVLSDDSCGTGGSSGDRRRKSISDSLAHHVAASTSGIDHALSLHLHR